MDENQSESTRKISSVNKHPEVTEKVLYGCTSTSSTASHYCLRSFYVHNGLSIYQTKYLLQDHVTCLTTPSLLNIQSSGQGCTQGGGSGLNSTP